MRINSALIRAILAAAFLHVLASCTPGGQFDPTVLLNNDMFDTKKKLKGDRTPVFPSGVPGTTTGVPADLVKGYKPPPDTDTDSGTPAVAAAPPPKPKPAPQAKPKLKPKPKTVVEKPPSSQPTRIDVGSKEQQPTPPPGGWPAPSATSAQTAWPPPPAPAQQGAPTAWPPPQQTAPAQQTGQSSQSIWPNPPAPANTSQ